MRVEVAMLENWYEVQISHTDSVANDQTVRQLIYPLLTPSSTARAVDSTERIKTGMALKKELQPLLQVHHDDGCIIFDREQHIAAASNDDLVGLERVEQYQPLLTRVLAGQSTVSAPMTSMVLLRNADGQLQSNMPTMFACSPVRDSDFQVVGAIALRIRPEDAFTKILQLGRLGSSGETYAFNREGLMVSNSRFDHDLILADLLPTSCSISTS
ncbi:MAG: cache domain-containing protein [Pirellulales bacterium]